MRYVFLLMISLMFTVNLIAQDSIQATIVLVGDAGQLTNGRHPVVSAVKQIIPMNRKTTVIFLGDNLYKTGLPDNSLPTYDIAKAPLDSQIHIAGNSDAKVYFIPGNHDWANGGSNGYESILRVQSYIDVLSNSNVTMLPRDGCPGPVEVKINNDVMLVIIDSQWWLHEFDKPGIESDCPYKTKAEVLVQLEDILSRNDKKLVLLAMHHPFRSYGQHGGFFTLKQHIFPFTDAMPKLYIPLPILGSAYPLTRAVFGTSEDLKHPFYQSMKNDIEGVVNGHKNVIYVSGHEHTLQMIQDSGYNYIVSGSGSKTSRVSKSRHTLFASPDNGFVVLDVSKNKNVQATFYVVEGDYVRNAYANNILDFSRIPLKASDTIRQVEYAFKDSVVISATDKYKNYSGFKQFLLGKNYRKEWSTPVTFKVFNISKEKGGLTIESLGGGKQTKSLKMKDAKGNEWTLRSVEKDPEKALPTNLRRTIAQNIVEDMISASNPYAPLVVPTISIAVGVPTPEPEFFFVPDDVAFGYYRPLFANTVCMLESRTPDVDKDPKSTFKVLSKMYEDNDHHVDQQKVLNARLLDMLIGDFDRHADQWKWGTADTGKGKLYYPIPKDRDQAFFNSDGLALKYLSKKHMPFLQGFKRRVRNINGLNYVARDFDRLFLNNLNRSDWEGIIGKFVKNLPDTVIKQAVTNFPPPVIAMDAKMVEEKLISRRNDLMKDALHYYRFISKTVSIAGSNKAEFFHIKKHPAGMELTVYKKNSTSDSATVMYHRVLDEHETKEIRLFGLNGDDKFEIDQDVSSKIRVRIIGGKGTDTFNLAGNVRNYIYDLSTEKNVTQHLRRTKNEFSSNPAVNDYKNNGYQYNKTLFPILNLGYNPEDKILIGLGMNAHTYGFRKDPYATFQKINTLYAPGFGAYQVKYHGIFNNVLLKNDIVLNAEWINPTLNNFYGYGNETVYDKTRDREFYRVRNNALIAELFVRKRVTSFLDMSVGPVYYRYNNSYKFNKGRILEDPAVVGRDSAAMYSVKNYAGFKVKADINYTNSEVYPTRGITWYTDFTQTYGINSHSHSYAKLSTDMTIYASISDQSRLSAVIRVGMGHIFSKDFEYFQAMNIGANNYVRGFRKNRFSGRSMAYQSTELRVKLFKSKSYLFPGDVGLLSYYDLGKVWIKSETSKKIHSSFGGGFYFVPYSLISLSVSMGFSNEDRLVNVSLGTKFNINF
ncbi:MAG: BamA/TamA family outer membrane protein [Ferruginibacter sp.]